MHDVIFPVSPLVFHLVPGLPFAATSCPAFVNKGPGSPGSEPSENQEFPLGVGISQFHLKAMRHEQLSIASKYLNDVALPHAKRLKVIDAETWIPELLAIVVSPESPPDATTYDGRKAMAHMYLSVTAQNVANLADVDARNRPVDLAQLKMMQHIAALQACVAGLLAAIASESALQNPWTPHECWRFGVNEVHGISQEPLVEGLISEGFGP